jgi:ATP-independent RNA helicase DbpA
MHASGTVYLILAGPDTVPSFVNCVPEEGKLPPRAIIPSPPEWETLYIGAGKKDRINKVDIVGVILQKGKLKREDLGLIEVLDKASYAAIKRDKIESVVRLLKTEKIKGRKIRIDIAR